MVEISIMPVGSQVAQRPPRTKNNGEQNEKSINSNTCSPITTGPS